MYQVFTCKKCRNEFIALTECINNNTGYMACTYCGSRSIKIIGKYNDLNNCMEHSSYIRENGAIKQKR